MQTVNDYLSVSVDRGQVPPVLRINGRIVQWRDVQLLNNRKAIRQRLADMPDGSKLVAYTMAGAILPLAK